MQHPTKKFVNMEGALRELGPFIKSGVLLEKSTRFKQFAGLLLRELWANWLICAAANAHEGEGERFELHGDLVEGGDGVIVDTKTNEAWPMEHVLVPRPREGDPLDTEAAIIKAIEAKQKKGLSAYASGKTLVVFLNSGGVPWTPNRVARNLPPHDFGAVWVVGLREMRGGEYLYNVANLHFDIGNVPIWVVRIANDFASWQVGWVQ